MSEVKVNKISPRSGTTVTLGDSGDTISVPSGVTLSTASFSSTGIDDNATSTAVTIDSSGNVLVGTTNNAPAQNNVTGVSLRPTDASEFSQDGETVISLNRKSSSGTVQIFRKDGTVFGRISVRSNTDMAIGSSDSAITFKSSDTIYPSNSSGEGRDNAIDLGDTSTRFRNIYLGGGLYVGGTGTANKLDDYEEGTWTPVFEGSTSNPTITYDAWTHGVYNKVGNVVFARGFIRTDSVSGGSGDLKLAGFPFNFPAQVYGATVLIQQISSWGTAPAFTFNDNNADTVIFNDSSGTRLVTSDLATGSNSNQMQILAVYQV